MLLKACDKPQAVNASLFFFKKVLIVLVLGTFNKIWGEIIKKIGVILVLAIAMLSVPVLSQGMPVFGPDGGDLLGDGIFEAGESDFEFPGSQDTNIDPDGGDLLGDGIFEAGESDFEFPGSQDTNIDPDGEDLLGDGIFEAGESDFEFPGSQDTNIDTAESAPVVDV